MSTIFSSTQSNMGEAITNKVALLDLEPSRKGELNQAWEAMSNALASADSNVPLVALCEGATGVTGNYRSSTDPDENMALKTASFLSFCNQAPLFVGVADSGNKAHTTAFLNKLGATTAELPTDTLQPRTIYVFDESDQSEVDSVVSLTSEGRKVVVLGPPLGHSASLVDGKSSVFIMGSVAQDENGNLADLSTNTRNAASRDFFHEVLKHDSSTQMSSRAMSKFTIKLGELARVSELITDDDKAHWAKNTQQQFTGEAPWHLMTKRITNSGGSAVFDKDTVTLPTRPKGDKTSTYVKLLQQTGSATINEEALTSVIYGLGEGYEYLSNLEDGTQAKKNLKVLARDASHSGFIDKLSPMAANATFGVIAGALKNIYEEKTDGGWGEKPGKQWTSQSFLESYQAKPGQQIPYDSIVLLQAAMGSLPEGNAGDMALLTLIDHV